MYLSSYPPIPDNTLMSRPVRHYIYKLLFIDLTIHVEIKFLDVSLTCPLRNTSIIAKSSSSSNTSPSSFATLLRFLILIFPVPSSSNNWNARRISSNGSRWRIYSVIVRVNSSCDSKPLSDPDVCKILRTSGFLTSNPRARIATYAMSNLTSKERRTFSS